MYISRRGEGDLYRAEHCSGTAQEPAMTCGFQFQPDVFSNRTLACTSSSVELKVNS